MAKKNKIRASGIVDCACVIHGTVYDWIYVERLYNMLSRHFVDEIRLHVYTEPTRSVPAHMIKHELEIWPGIEGPKRSWWYKMQLFNERHWQGPLLYFDLDIVIYNNLQWCREVSLDYFWTLRDFRYLQNSAYNKMNSSVMYWDTRRFGYLWDRVQTDGILDVVMQYSGDQDYIWAKIDRALLRYYDSSHVQSFRWEAMDGGMNFATRKNQKPNTGVKLSKNASVLVFHGRPKPHEVKDSQIQALWV